jgi:hypothetical protein
LNSSRERDSFIHSSPSRAIKRYQQQPSWKKDFNLLYVSANMHRRSRKQASSMLLFSVLVLFVQVAVGFVGPGHPQTPNSRRTSSPARTVVSGRTPAPSSVAPLRAIDVASVDQARTAFFIWLFGASGGAGIARSAFPRMFRNFQATRQMKSSSKSSAEEQTMIGISPLCGYPQDIPVKDVLQIVQKSNVAQMVQKYPIAGNFLSRQGYLTYAAFQQAHVKANPLAVRAVFDALNKGSDVCTPDQAQETIDELKVNPMALAGKVLRAKFVGYGAIFALLFLLALADYQAFVVHFRMGWFPEWPGLDDLPRSLLDPSSGLSAIPQYWLGEYK